MTDPSPSDARPGASWPAPLTAAYLRRLGAPRGEGDLVPADLAGEVGSIVGGGGVRVMLRVDRRGRVTDASFRALGSLAARGPGSVLVERLVGATVDDARTLRADDLLAPLGPVPPAVVAAAARCLDALHLALDDGEAAARSDAPGLLTCRCLGVGDREIRRAIARGARTVPMIGHDCAAGTGCHSCWPDLRALLAEHAGPRVPSRGVGSPRARGAHGEHGEPETLQGTVAALVTPLLAAQGVEVTAVEVEGRNVRLALGVIEADAMASPIGAVALAQFVLRETIDPAVRVALAPPPAPAG